MPGGNGNEGIAASMASGVRGGEPPAGDPVRSEVGGWTVGGSAPVIPSQQYPQAVPLAPPASTNQIGFSITLTQAQVEQAVKARAIKVASSRGVAIPTDETDFQFRARVHWQSNGSAAVTLEV
jgi:hypothetical protein